MRVFAMNIAALRTIILIGVLLAAATYWTGVELVDWRNVSRELMDHSPDAHHSISALQIEFGFFGGCCIGMSICTGLCAIAQRTQIAAAGYIAKAHWIGAALPSIAVIIIYNVVR